MQDTLEQCTARSRFAGNNFTHTVQSVICPCGFGPWAIQESSHSHHRLRGPVQNTCGKPGTLRANFLATKIEIGTIDVLFLIKYIKGVIRVR
jgi:hypothetical protein